MNVYLHLVVDSSHMPYFNSVQHCSHSKWYIFTLFNSKVYLKHALFFKTAPTYRDEFNFFLIVSTLKKINIQMCWHLTVAVTAKLLQAGLVDKMIVFGTSALLSISFLFFSLSNVMLTQFYHDQLVVSQVSHQREREFRICCAS